LFNREDDPGLIIGIHDGDNSRIVIDRSTEFIHVKTSLAVDIQLGHTVAVLGEAAANGQNGGVFHPGGDNMAPVGKDFKGRSDGGIVAFRAASGENDFFRMSPEQRCYPLPGFIDFLLHLPPEIVHRARVAVKFRKIRPHLLKNRFIYFCCRIIVEVNLSHPWTSSTVISSATSSLSFCSTNLEVNPEEAHPAQAFLNAICTEFPAISINSRSPPSAQSCGRTSFSSTSWISCILRRLVSFSGFLGSSSRCSPMTSAIRSEERRV